MKKIIYLFMFVFCFLVLPISFGAEWSETFYNCEGVTFDSGGGGKSSLINCSNQWTGFIQNASSNNEINSTSDLARLHIHDRHTTTGSGYLYTVDESLENYRFNENTQFSLTIKRDYTCPDQDFPLLYFGHGMSDLYNLLLYISSSSGYPANRPVPEAECELASYIVGGGVDEVSYRVLNWNYSTLVNDCGFSPVNLSGISSFIFWWQSANCNKEMWIANFTISELGIFSLPTMSDTVINSECYNSTEEKALINISFVINNSYETGNVYYAVNNLNKEIETFTYIEDFVNFHDGCDVDTYYLLSDYINANSSVSSAFDTWSCAINRLIQSTICLSSELKTYYDIDQNMYFDECRGFLTFYSDPKNIFIDSDKIFFSNSSFTEQFYIPNEKTIYNIDFMDSFASYIINITFNQTSYGNLSIKINGTEVLNKVHDPTDIIQMETIFIPEIEMIYFDIGWFSYPSTSYTSYNYSYNVSFENFAITQHRSYFNYVHLNSWIPQIKISAYEFWGIEQEKISNWELLSLVNNSGEIVFNTSEVGTRYINIYLTNSLQTDYNKYSFIENIYRCEEDIRLPDTDFTEFLGDVKEVSTEFCSVFDSIFDSFGGIPLGMCNIIIIVICVLMLLTTISLIGMVNAYTHLDFAMSVIFGSLFWSIGMGLFSFLFNYSTSLKIIISVIFTLSLVAFFLNIFFSRGSGGNE